MTHFDGDIETRYRNASESDVVANEETSLLGLRPSDAALEVAKQDTTEPYLAVVMEELRWIASSSSLTVLTGILQSSIVFVNVMSVGHLGTSELAAMVISVSPMIMLVYAPAVGLMSAMETFCSTAYTASRDKTIVGFHFQRGIVAAFAQLIVVSPILWNGEKLLLAIGQDELVARLGGTYLRIHILGLLPWTLFEACKRFLNSQGIMRAGTIIMLYSAPFHWTLNFFLVRSETYGIGFIGAPIANIAVEWLMFLSAVIYICNSRAAKAWGGWDYRVLHNMSEYWRLAIPSVATICSDWIGFQLVTMLISYFDVNKLAGHGVMFNTAIFVAEIGTSIGAGVGPRIGNLIGAAKPRQARVASDVAIFLSLLTSMLAIIFLALRGKWWISILTDNADVAYEAAKLLPLACILLIGDGLNALLAGIMRGLGRQKFGAIANIIGFNVMALPLELLLGFWVSMEAPGVWLGLCIGVVFICMLQLVYLYIWIDWKDEVRLCFIRLRRSHGDSSEYIEVPAE